jgi:hypothetical protein
MSLGQGTVNGLSYVKATMRHPLKYGAIRSIYITHSNGTYDKNKKQFHYLTDQIGNPDVVWV